MRARKIGWLLGAVALSGCASVNLDAGFPEVRATVEERSGHAIAWNRGTELDREAAEQLQALLARPLGADDAVQVALLNNRDLQATYAELGLAQADLVQAGLFRNPLLEAGVFFPLTGVRPDFQLNLAIGFLDALYLPLRKRVAASAFEEARLRVTGSVLDLAGRVRGAFYVHQADAQMLELRQNIVETLSASLELSRRLHQAGNITDLDLARDRGLAEMSRLALRSAEVDARQSREELNGLMGLWGDQTGWTIAPRLPDVAAPPPPVDDLERLAVARSLDLAAARQRVVTAGQQLGYSRATALVPDAELGAGAEREGEEAWKVGPSVVVPLPLFDQGQARVGRSLAELRRAQQEYYGLAVRIRATARSTRDRLLGAQDRALYYRDVVLPLQERIVSESQLQYNAMQVGAVQLLRDRERQIESGVQYVQTLLQYWLAQADLAQLASGRLPSAGRSPARAMDTRLNMRNGAGH